MVVCNEGFLSDIHPYKHKVVRSIHTFQQICPTFSNRFHLNNRFEPIYEHIQVVPNRSNIQYDILADKRPMKMKIQLRSDHNGNGLVDDHGIVANRAKCVPSMDVAVGIHRRLVQIIRE
ncbi:hypothetical protein RDWZM_007164 [Blomia tropicalis]|uniref:Uncharacterized protein n=1 Tax=Blomia tropicalis TaxID=40697 RepID=A0A9Q0MB70_BLOTA|nr:hypothetical protein RDWZM_007164 [Blomia tropicalis]